MTADLQVALAAHPFTDGMDADHLAEVAALARVERIDAGDFVLRAGRDAEALHLVTAGDVALEVHRPGRPPLVLETIHAGDALGWSWLHPPHRWHFDALATSEVSTIACEARRLRALILDDPVFGAELVLRVSRILTDRLHHARRQLAMLEEP